MQRPFFSTIIPVYNRPELVAAAINSALSQEFNDQEIIVVDDGSTDGTQDVLAAFGEQIKVLRQAHRGPGAARNFGIQLARGEYVAFLDSDDLWFPWTLAAYRVAINGHARPAFVAGTALELSEEQWHARDAFIASTADTSEFHTKAFLDYLAACHEVTWVGTCGVAIRSEWLKRANGFDAANINGEDSDLWLRLGDAPGFVYIMGPPVFTYRRHSASTVRDHKKSVAGANRLLESERSSIYPGGVDRSNERLEVLTRHIRPLSLTCLRNGYLSAAWSLYVRSFQWNLRRRRVRYLLGFPIYSMCCLAKQIVDGV